MVDNIEFKRKASCDPWCHILFHRIQVVLVMTEVVGSTFLLVLEVSSSEGQAQFAAIHHVQLSLRMKWYSRARLKLKLKLKFSSNGIFKPCKVSFTKHGLEKGTRQL